MLAIVLVSFFRLKSLSPDGCRQYWFVLLFIGIKIKLLKLNETIFLSQCFTVSNGVRQGGILSPYLFNVYMDQLSLKLNQLDIGCHIGKKRLNNLIYADDLCCFAPTSKGLQKLVEVCTNYAVTHNIVFNSNKTKAPYFS